MVSRLNQMTWLTIFKYIKQISRIEIPSLLVSSLAFIWVLVDLIVKFRFGNIDKIECTYIFSIIKKRCLEDGEWKEFHTRNIHIKYIYIVNIGLPKVTTHWLFCAGMFTCSVFDGNFYVPYATGFMYFPTKIVSKHSHLIIMVTIMLWQYAIYWEKWLQFG